MSRYRLRRLIVRLTRRPMFASPGQRALSKRWRRERAFVSDRRLAQINRARLFRMPMQLLGGALGIVMGVALLARSGLDSGVFNAIGMVLGGVTGAVVAGRARDQHIDDLRRQALHDVERKRLNPGAHSVSAGGSPFAVGPG